MKQTTLTWHSPHGKLPVALTPVIIVFRYTADGEAITSVGHRGKSGEWLDVLDSFVIPNGGVIMWAELPKGEEVMAAIADM